MAAVKHLEEYLEYLAAARSLSPHTLRAYRTDLLRWSAALLPEERADPGSIGTAEIKSYLSRLIESGLDRRSVARHLSAIKGFYRFLQAAHRIEAHPAEGIKLPGRPRSLPRVLTQEQMERLLDARSGDPVLDARDRAALETLYSTGVRVSELVGLDLSDLDLQGGLARVMGKGRRERIAMLGSHARAALAEWLDVRRPLAADPAEQAVFLHRRGARLSDRSVRRLLDRALLRAGLAGRVTPHTLRHSFATHLLARGAGIKEVQQMLGHRLLSSTQIYTHVSPEHLRRAYESAHPRSRGRTPVRRVRGGEP